MSFGETCECQKELGPQRSRNAATSGKNERLEDAQQRLSREGSREHRQTTRYHIHYGSEKEDWRVQNMGSRRHQHQPPKTSFPFIK